MEHVPCTGVCVRELRGTHSHRSVTQRRRLTLGEPGRFIPWGLWLCRERGWSVVTCCKVRAGARLTPSWGWQPKATGGVAGLPNES